MCRVVGLMKKGVSSNNLVVTLHFSLKISSHPCFAGPLGIIASCSFPDLESGHLNFSKKPKTWKITKIICGSVN